jgi:hypothetical protein
MFIHLNRVRLVNHMSAFALLFKIIKMSIKFSGVFSRSGGIYAAISKQIRLMNFRGVKRCIVRFDPFDETNIKPTR